MATLRNFDFCCTQKIISFKSKGSLLILRPLVRMCTFHTAPIKEVTAAADCGHQTIQGGTILVIVPDLSPT